MANMKRQRTPVLVKFGQRVRECREQRGLSQTQLARALDIHPTNVSHLEAGRQDITVTQLVRAAKELGVSVGDLVASLAGGSRARGNRSMPPTIARAVNGS